MDPVIEFLIEHIERYSKAGDRLAARLHTQRRWNTEDIESLRGGSTLAESIEATRSADRSRDLTQVMAEFEQSRREIRAAVAAAALAEGMTIAQVGEIFGVSRQLANRFVKEARHLGYLPE